MEPDTPADNKSAPQKLPPSAYVMCGWPLLLVAIGGAVGGALGGAAFAINLAIYKSALPRPVKFILNPIVGIAAFLGWLAIAVAVGSARQ